MSVGALFCFARCDACACGMHYAEPTPHSWAGPEDVAHALATGQHDPSESQCACWCTTEGDPDAMVLAEDQLDADSLDVEPCEICGEPGACAYDAEGRPMIHTAVQP